MATPLPKVLWVDDDANVWLEPLAHRIRRSGVELDIATSFDAAERRLRQTIYSAILLDVILPSGGILFTSDVGLELARRIRAGDYRDPSSFGGTPADAKIVLLTVVMPSEIENKIRELNVDYFGKLDLLEPGTIERLINSLRTP